MTQLTSNQNDNEMLTVAELAEFLRVGLNTAYKFVAEGKVPSVKVGRQIRIYKADILALAKQQKLEIGLLNWYN